MMNNPDMANNMEQISSIVNNPEFVNMAQNLMQDPSFQEMMTNMMGGMGGMPGMGGMSGMDGKDE